MKQYKPGQIVTIAGKLYRIAKVEPEFNYFPCSSCLYHHCPSTAQPCDWCLTNMPIRFGKPLVILRVEPVCRK